MLLKDGALVSASEDPRMVEAAKVLMTLVMEGVQRNIPADTFASMDREDRASSALAVAAQHLLWAAGLQDAPREAGAAFGCAAAQAVVRTDMVVGVVLASQGFAFGMTTAMSHLTGASIKTEGNA
jgi:hypothetical protein